MQSGGHQHHAWVGRVPQDGPILATWPGKDPLRVRRQEPLWVQIPTIGQEAIGIGLMRVWKSHTVGEALSWHRTPWCYGLFIQPRRIPAYDIVDPKVATGRQIAFHVAVPG